MWSNKKPWWQRKAGDNEGKHNKNLPFARTWCVFKVARMQMSRYQWGHEIVTIYKAAPKLNAPKWFDENGKPYDSIVVDHLYKSEAQAVAKGLNFLDGED